MEDPTGTVTLADDATQLNPPDGAMVAIEGEPYAVRGGHLLRWTFDGYADALPRKSVAHAALITPPFIVTILKRGYRPRWHESARHLAAASLT